MQSNVHNLACQIVANRRQDIKEEVKPCVRYSILVGDLSQTCCEPVVSIIIVRAPF